MKEFNDDELQRLLETEPMEGLPYNFASKVRSSVQVEVNRKKDIRFYLMAFGGLILGFASFYGLLSVVNVDAGNAFIDIVFRYKWLLVFASVVFMAILYVDQKLVKERGFINT